MAEERDPEHHTYPGLRNPTCRATGPDGDLWDEPSEDLLYLLLHDCEYDGDVVIIERDATHFARTAWAAGQPWVVEYRNGSADEHFQGRTSDMGIVLRVLLGYGYQIDGWEDLLDWTKLTFD